MNTNRSNIVNKQLIYLLALTLIVSLSSSCIVQKAQKSSEQNDQSSPAEQPHNRIGCKSPAEIEEMKQTAESKRSNLRHAVIQRDIKLVKKLLQQNVDVNEMDNYGRTLLFSVITPSVEEPELTPPGEAPRRIPRQAEQARQREARQKEQAQIEMTRELLAHGVNPNQKDIYGDAPVIRAAGFGYKPFHAMKLLALLVQYKADVNVQDKSGFTALMGAARNNEPEVVKFLLDHNANPDLTNCDGQTALSIAEAQKFADVVRLLKQQQFKQK